MYVVDQVDPDTGKFDEHKAILRTESIEEAKQTYLRNYQEGWKGAGGITEMSMDQFKSWVKSGRTKERLSLPSKKPTEISVKTNGKTSKLSAGETAKGAVNDRANQGGIHGEIGEGQEPLRPVQEPGAGGETVSAGGNVQGNEGEQQPGKGPKISSDLVDALKEATQSITEINKSTQTPPGKMTDKEVAGEKANVKAVLHREIKNGTIPVGHAVRATRNCSRRSSSKAAGSRGTTRKSPSTVSSRPFSLATPAS